MENHKTKEIHKFILSAICNDDQESYNSFLDSLALIVQEDQPLEQRIGIWFTGDEAGKNAFHKYLVETFESICGKVHFDYHWRNLTMRSGQILPTTTCVLVDDVPTDECLAKLKLRMSSETFRARVRDERTYSEFRNKIRGIIVFNESNKVLSNDLAQYFTAYDVKTSEMTVVMTGRLVNEYKSYSPYVFLEELRCREIGVEIQNKENQKRKLNDDGTQNTNTRQRINNDGDYLAFCDQMKEQYLAKSKECDELKQQLEQQASQEITPVTDVGQIVFGEAYIWRRENLPDKVVIPWEPFEDGKWIIAVSGNGGYFMGLPEYHAIRMKPNTLFTFEYTFNDVRKITRREWKENGQQQCKLMYALFHTMINTSVQDAENGVQEYIAHLIDQHENTNANAVQRLG